MKINEKIKIKIKQIIWNKNIKSEENKKIKRNKNY